MPTFIAEPIQVSTMKKVISNQFSPLALLTCLLLAGTCRNIHGIKKTTKKLQITQEDLTRIGALLDNTLVPITDKQLLVKPKETVQKGISEKFKRAHTASTLAFGKELKTKLHIDAPGSTAS